MRVSSQHTIFDQWPYQAGNVINIGLAYSTMYFAPAFTNVMVVSVSASHNLKVITVSC